MSTRAYLSLGSNIEPTVHLRAAIGALHARFEGVVVSPAYRFAAVGFDGPDFLNCAAGIDSDLDAVALDRWLHALEARQGRRRDGPRFSSRTLDVDIVLFGDLVSAGRGHLQIPRDDLHHAFVLKPLADIAPDLVPPNAQVSLLESWQRLAPTAGAFERVDLD